MRIKTFCLVLGTTFLLSNCATAASVTAETLDQIVVTAARTPLTVRQVGSAVTVITRADIEQREARRVIDLLRSVPGFSVTQSGVSGTLTEVRVRGAEANHVLVLIDGVRANDPATGDTFRWEFLSTNNIERIEIVRGPQSSLWGSDAVSAVVHIITRTEVTDSNIGGYLEGGSFGTSNGGINAAFGGNNWSLNASVEHLTTDGDNISRLGNEDDDSDQTSVALSVKLSVNDTLSFNAGLRSMNADSQFDPVDFFVTGLPTDGNSETEAENLYLQAGVELQTYGGRVSHRFDARYSDSDNRNFSDGIEGISSASDRVSFLYQSDIRISENTLSLALEHEQTDFSQTGAIGFGDPNQTQEMDVTSAIVEFQNLSNEKFSWIVSTRFDNNSDFDDSLNGRLSLAYQLTDATNLRGHVATGQKSPTFIERFGFFPGQFVGNPNLQPEQSTSSEIGIDQSFLEGTLLLQVSLFHQDLSDEINGFVFDPVTFVVTAENRTGKSKRDGAELAVRWNVGDAFGLGAHYTYTDATQPDFSGNDVHELRRPKHSGGLSAELRALEERFSANLTADYGGTRTDIFFPPFPDSSQIVALSSYWLLDLAVHYQATESITLFAKGSNLLDDDYEEVFGYSTLGRAGFAGVRINFGRR